MRIAVLREASERRVALTPAVVGRLVGAGHVVEVEAGVATVSWDPGESAEGDDTYLVARTDAGGGAPVVAEEPAVDIEVEDGVRPCFEVTAQRGSRPSVEASEEGCAP